MRKIFTFLCAALMSVGMFALTPKGTDVWDDNTKTLTVKSNPQDDYYNDQGEIKRLVISSSVTEIGEQAFSSNYNLQEVIAYDGLQVIDQSAFFSCPNLESVILPSTLQEVRYSAFGYCDNLKYVTINAPSLDDYAEYAFDDTHADLKIYVPEASVATYKYFWPAYASKFQAIPSSLAVGDTLKVGDAMYSATDVYVDAGYLRFQIKASFLHTISAISVSSENIKVEFTPYAEEFYPSGSYAALTNWFYCPSEYTSGDVTAITVASGTGTLDDPFVIDYVNPTPEPEPQGETITVTWNGYDLPSYGSSFTKDGVTLTCDIDDSDLYGPGTFTTDLGNFTQIVVSAYDFCYIEATGGWSGDINQKTWTGNAAIVPFDGNIYAFSTDVTIVFTIEPASTPEPAGEVITWGLDFCSEVSAWCDNGEIVGEENSKDGITVTYSGEDNYDGMSGGGIWLYGGSSSKVIFSSAVGDISKIEVYYYDDPGLTPPDWTLDATNNKFVWEGTPAASVDMMRGTAGNIGFMVDHIVFTIGAAAPTAIENVQSNKAQSTKLIRNGMLLIERNGKLYNATGAEVK